MVFKGVKNETMIVDDSSRNWAVNGKRRNGIETYMDI